MASYHHNTLADRLEPIAGAAISPVRENDARYGSTVLRDRIETMFVRFEVQHRLEAGEGRVLLLDTGVKL